jgi:transglutaminase-like putative cysteine protease
MTILQVHHRTEYRYKRPVSLGDHRLMSRPRDSHDLRLLSTSLIVTPTPSEIRWMHDVFGNSIAVSSFSLEADTLVFDSTFRAEHFPLPERTIWIEPYAQTLPFSYNAADSADLGCTKQRQYADPDNRIDAWAKAHVDAQAERNTLDIIVAMMKAIKSGFAYRYREEAGVQAPLDTLTLGSGSCRDFAVFLMEAVRSIGLAAQFVSGYLYDEKMIGASGGLVGSGATHAWMQVYLPGAGWVEFDPTNALIGGRNLIRVAVARDASQAAPLAGSFIGASDDFLSMRVRVEVTAE